MANRAGLRKVVKTVRTKKGVARRSYWVRGTDAVKSGARAAGGFVGRHKGAIAAGVLAAGLIGLNMYGHRQAGTTNTGAYALERNAGKGRLRSAASAFGAGTGIGAGFAASGAANYARSWSQPLGAFGAGVRDLARSGADRASFVSGMARQAGRGEYGEQRRAGTGRVRSAARAARSVFSVIRNA